MSFLAKFVRGRSPRRVLGTSDTIWALRVRIALVLIGLLPTIYIALTRLQPKARLLAELETLFAWQCARDPISMFPGRDWPLCSRCMGLYFGIAAAGLLPKVTKLDRVAWVGLALGAGLWAYHVMFRVEYTPGRHDTHGIALGALAGYAAARVVVGVISALGRPVPPPDLGGAQSP